MQGFINSVNNPTKLVRSRLISETAWEQHEINYPTGFTKENCVVLSWVRYLYENNNIVLKNQIYGLYDNLGGAFNSVVYNDNGVTITVNNNVSSSSERKALLEVIFMKVR